MKWNRFNLLSPAGEHRGQPLTDITVEVVVAVAVLRWSGEGGVASPQSPLVNEISATTDGE